MAPLECGRPDCAGATRQGRTRPPVPAIERRHPTPIGGTGARSFLGSACPPRPDQRYDSFSLNARLVPDDRPFRYSSDGTSVARLDRSAKNVQPPGTEGPRHRPGPHVLASHSERIERAVIRPSSGGVPPRPQQRLIEQCHLQCFPATEPPTSAPSPRSDRTTRPSSAPSILVRFCPAWRRPSRWIDRPFTFQRLRADRPAPTQQRMDRFSVRFHRFGGQWLR